MIRWSPDLAYAVGLITADGCLYNDSRHISLVSKDRDQIQTFTRILGLKNKISRKSSGSSIENKKYYHVQFGDVEFYRELLNIGLMPNKSKQLKSVKVPDKYFADFLRGHFDGDGYSNSYWDPRWRSSFMLYTGFYCASLPFLEWMDTKIQKLFGIKGKIRYMGKSTYGLRFAKYASISLISKMYYHPDIPYLKRKRVKIQKSLDIINRV